GRGTRQKRCVLMRYRLKPATGFPRTVILASLLCLAGQATAQTSKTQPFQAGGSPDSKTNQPPVADNQTVTTPEDTATAIALTAHDPDGKPLTYSIVTKPSHGFVNLSGSRAVYTPHADYNGQ